MKNNEIIENDKTDIVDLPIKQTPSKKLADIIVKRLITEGIIDDKAAKNLFNKISDGKINQDDWRLLIETQRKQEGN